MGLISYKNLNNHSGTNYYDDPKKYLYKKELVNLIPTKFKEATKK